MALLPKRWRRQGPGTPVVDPHDPRITCVPAYWDQTRAHIGYPQSPEMWDRQERIAERLKDQIPWGHWESADEQERLRLVTHIWAMIRSEDPTQYDLTSQGRGTPTGRIPSEWGRWNPDVNIEVVRDPERMGGAVARFVPWLTLMRPRSELLLSRRFLIDPQTSIGTVVEVLWTGNELGAALAEYRYQPLDDSPDPEMLLTANRYQELLLDWGPAAADVGGNQVPGTDTPVSLGRIGEIGGQASQAPRSLAPGARGDIDTSREMSADNDNELPL